MPRRPKSPNKNVYIHPAVHFIHSEVLAKKTTYRAISEKSGIAASTIRKWRRGESTPNIIDLELVVMAFGARMGVVREKDNY